MAGLAQIAKIMKAVGAGESVSPQALKILRASEALGPYEGKVLNVTSTNRALYGSNNGKNRSGSLFSRQQLVDPNFGQSIWGLAKPNKATAMVNASTPETVWSTYIGAPEQLRGDPSILQDALHEFHANVDQLTPETRQALNNHFVKNGLVPKGFDIGTDALAIDPYSMTFETRTKMADALGSGTGLGRVPQKTIIDMPGIIARNSDPMMEGLPNFSVGSQLFTLNGRKTFRPDLNADFPHQVEGNNLDVTFLPAPVEHALPDLHAKVLADIASGDRKAGNMISDFDLRGYGKQPITHDMLMGLDKAGHKQGGVVHAGAGGWMKALKHAKSSNSATGNPWHVALKKAQHMAIGGPVLGPQDTKPDISDGGNIIQDGAFAKGGTVRHFEDGGYTDPLSIPDAPVSEDTRQSIADVGRALKAQYEREKAQLKKQGGVKDLALQTGSVLAGQLPEMANWLQTKVPSLSKPDSVLPMSGKQFEKVEADRVPKVKLPDTEAINDAMREAGMTENDYPLLSNAASLFAPAGLSKIASLTKGLPVGASILDVSKAAPALESGVKQGVKYATRQDGPFFRVAPSTTEGTSAADRGVREILSQPSADTSGAGQIRNKIAQVHSPQDVEGLMQPESNIALQAADQYSRKNMGRPFAKLTIPESSLSKQSPIATTFMAAVEGSPEYKQAVFDAYKRQMPKVINKSGAKDYDDLMKKAYEQIAKETDEQFKHLPVNMSYHRAGEGNYVSSQEMLSDVHGNKHLYVFQGGDEHPFLNAVDPATGLNQNEKFRAVHDFFGHGIDGNQFGPKGEEQAFADHSQMYSPLARIALASETRGQNSVVNYSPLNAELKKQLAILDQQAYDAKRAGHTEKYNQIKADRKAAFNDLQFAPNVPVVLPPEFIDPMFSGGMPSYLNGIIKPPQGSTTSSVLTHYSHSPDLQQTNPAFYGTGIKGREAERLQAKDAVKNRTYFYLGEPGEVRPEPGLGINKYRTESDNLYDLSADPLKLRTLAAEANRTPWTAKYNNGITDATQNLNDVERMIKEHGFSGYISPESKAAAVFEPMKVKKQARGGLAALAQ
jgi:hypothetical protein